MKTNLSFATKTKSVVIVAVVLASITGYYYWTDITSFFMKLWGALPSLVSMNTISLFFAVVIAPLALLLSLYLLIRYINKKWAEIKKIRAEKIKRENEEALFNSLVGLPLSLLALEYMHRCSLLKPDTKETEKKAAEIYLSALIQTAKSGFTLSTDDLIQIVHKISHANYSLGRSFFNLIAGQCLEKGVPELIFSCQNT